jgi:hypothetical protein
VTGRIRLLVALPESPRIARTATPTPTIARYEIGKELEELVVVLAVEVVVGVVEEVVMELALLEVVELVAPVEEVDVLVEELVLLE